METKLQKTIFNPSEHVKSSVFAPLSRARAGRGDAVDGLGWTAVAHSPTLSVRVFSVSPKISICGLTNMANRRNLPAFRQPVQWWAEVDIGRSVPCGANWDTA